MRGEVYFQVLAHGIKGKVKKRVSFSQHVYSATTITAAEAGAVGPGEVLQDERGKGGRRHSQEERATEQESGPGSGFCGVHYWGTLTS